MKEYLTELHLHTKESSSCSEIIAQDMIKAYQAKRYSTIVITDHCSKNKMNSLGYRSWKEKIDYVYQGFELAKKQGNKQGMNILLGVEVTLQITDSHYLIYGMDREFLYQNENIYAYSLEQLYHLCQKNDYLLVQAHPFRDDIQLAPLDKIDGIEVYNGCQNEVSRNEKALEYGNNTNKILTSGSDFHRMEDLARGGIITEIEIRNSKQLVEILRSKKFKLNKNEGKSNGRI